MVYCYLCEKEPVEKYFGYWCTSCREIKNIMNVYGKDKVLEIVKKCCIRNTNQINNKINIELKTKKPADDQKDYDNKEKEKDKVYSLRSVKK